VGHVGNGDKRSIIEFKNNNTFSVKAVEKCISIRTEKMVKFQCGMNMSASSSSAKRMRNNNPCNPANETPKPF